MDYNDDDDHDYDSYDEDYPASIIIPQYQNNFFLSAKTYLNHSITYLNSLNISEEHLTF